MELLEPGAESAGRERRAEPQFVPGLREQMDRLRRAYPELTPAAIGRILRLPARLTASEETSGDGKA